MCAVRRDESKFEAKLRKTNTYKKSLDLLVAAASKCFSHEVTPFESLLKHVIITTMLPNCTWRSVSILYNQRFI